MAKTKIGTCKATSRAIIKAFLKKLQDEAIEITDMMSRDDEAVPSTVARNALSLTMGRDARRLERGTCNNFDDAVAGIE